MVHSVARLGWSLEIEYLFTRVIAVYGYAVLLNGGRLHCGTRVAHQTDTTVTSTLLSLLTNVSQDLSFYYLGGVVKQYAVVLL